MGSGCMEAIFHIYFQYCFPSAWHIDPMKTQHIFLKPWRKKPFRVAQNYLPINSWQKRVPRVIIWKWAADSYCWSCHPHSSSISGWRILQSTWIQGQSISLVFYAPHQSGWVMALPNSGSNRESDGMQTVVWTSLSRKTGCHFSRDLCI